MVILFAPGLTVGALLHGGLLGAVIPTNTKQGIRIA